jgi:hypothetical protein
MGNRNSEGEGMKKQNDDRKPAAPGLPIRLDATAKALRDRYRREWDELGISPPPFDESTGGCAWLAWWQGVAAEAGIDPNLIEDAGLHVAGRFQDRILGELRKQARPGTLHARLSKAALPDAPAGATPPTPQADAPPAPLGDEITAAQLCQRWDIPKSQVTKYTQKAPGDVNYLPSRKIGQNVYVKLADAEKWAENYEARRDARAKGKISNQDIRNALKRF